MCTKKLLKLGGYDESENTFCKLIDKSAQSDKIVTKPYAK